METHNDHEQSTSQRNAAARHARMGHWTRNFTAAFGAVLLLLVTTRVVRAFSSWLEGDWHANITVGALNAIIQGSCPLSAKAVDLIIKSDRAQDFDPFNQSKSELTFGTDDNGKVILIPNINGQSGCDVTNPCPYRWEHHFDRVKSIAADFTATDSAVVDGLAYLSNKRARIAAQSANRNTEAALIALGRALHAAQDFMSHSNYIDLAGINQIPLFAAVADSSVLGQTPSDLGLLITRYDYRLAGLDDPEEPPDGDPGRPYTHQTMALDWPGKNANSSPSRFAVAKDTAIQISIEFVRSVLNATPALCDQASRYPDKGSQNNSDSTDPGEPGKYPSNGSNDPPEPPDDSTFHGNGVGALDPNDKAGPVGSGAQRYASGRQPLRYAVFFSNEASASAPAQKVVVTDQLEVGTEDLNSINFGPIAFGNQLVSPSVGGGDLSVDLRPGTNLLVAIKSDINRSTGLLTWILQSLDPATNKPPADPLAGFLPPGIGGSVFFTVMPKQGLATGVEIQNQATIVFDTNAPISTITWMNTLDNTPPASHVLALPASEASASFPVQWTGSDIGSGIQDFTVYVSDNGGPFSPFLSNTAATSAPFTGQAGHGYGFYSVARDLVGNVESAHNGPDTQTTVTLNQSPVCVAAVASSPEVVADAAHSMSPPISILGFTDPDGDAIAITIDSIFQDEPVSDNPAYAPDGSGVGTSTASVRRERAGLRQSPGNGRVYYIDFTATDGRGGSCSGEVTVGVRFAATQPAVPDGKKFDSTIR